MALFVNVNIDHEMFEFWKGWKFPDLKIISNDDHERAGKVMMDKELYALAKDNKFNKLFQLLSTKDEAQLLSIFGKHVGPSGNSLLHGAAGSGSRATSELLAHHFPLLITKKNFNGDTALHVAAGRGYVDTVQTLLYYVASDPFTGGSGGDEKARELLRMRNDRGNTGLHEAVTNGKDEVAKLLGRVNPEVLYLKNREDKCPLYLAVEFKKKELLCPLLDASNDMPTATSLPEGKSVAHAALDLKQLDMLSEIAKRKPELMRVKDENGDNLLHLASSKTEWNWYEKDWASDLFGDCAIETNNQGHLPIHVACQNGHLGAVNWFLDQWPDPTEFLNVKGQTVLHVAAESGNYNLVQRILNEPKFEEIVNKRDMEGNTALHLATKNGTPMSVYALVDHKTVDKDIRDGENMTAYSTALHLAHSDKPEHASTDGKREYFSTVLAILYFHANDKGQAHKEYVAETTRSDPTRLGNREELISRINYLLVVSVLVAGVTFAGSIQVPAGGNLDANQTITNSSFTHSAHNHSGHLQFAEKKKELFQSYAFFDMLAFNTSIMSSIILCWAQLYDTKVATTAVWLAACLIRFSIYMMCLAFTFAMGIAVSSFFSFFIFLLVLEASFFFVQTVLSQPLLPPSRDRLVGNTLSPIIHFAVFKVSLLYMRMLLCLFPQKTTWVYQIYRK